MLLIFYENSSKLKKILNIKTIIYFFNINKLKMSVVLETSVGDIVIDLYYKTAPLAAKNFLKLCKMKFYNGTLFYNI